MKVAIPLNGKMAFRSFHAPEFIETFVAHGLSPVYFIDRQYVSEGLDPADYAEFKMDLYEQLYAKNRLLSNAALLRWFVVRTETTDLRFRDQLYDVLLSSKPKRLLRTLGYMMAMDVLRNIRPLGPLAMRLETAIAKTDFHVQDLRNRAVDCVLSPGVGSHDFLYEGLFAREAKRLGLPVYAAITNYDNIVNRGYPGFMPDRLLVWSKQMADDATRLLNIPASKIEVVGPVQFDRYFQPPSLSREEFLRSRGLDPRKKTIFYAGTVAVTQYFDFLKTVRTRLMTGDVNIVIRPAPHKKVLSWYGMSVFRDLLLSTPGIYYSDPFAHSSDTFMPIHGADRGAELDELHSLFKYSDVLINHYSTVSLEAAINDLPTIHIGYDDFTYGLRYPSYHGFHERMTHNRRPLRLAAAKIARNEDELICYIDLYLSDPSVDREQRRNYALAECEYLDGKATERLASVVRASRAGREPVRRYASQGVGAVN